MSCRLETERNAGAVHQERYARLHPEGRALIEGWLRRGRVVGESNDEWMFEAFIFLWIGFNAWGACVTGEDNDSAMIESLAADRQLNERFATYVEDDDSSLIRSARQFQALWPIFKVQELRELGSDYWPRSSQNRRKVVDTYVRGGATKFEPTCWLEHLASHEDPPLDWAHTIKALYRVRCNLFHGEKARSSEEDRIVVHAGHATLAAYLHESDLLE